MVSNLHVFLLSQNWARALLLLSDAPRTLRELADLAEMSPAGTRDVLRRLVDAGLVERRVTGKKTRYTAKLELPEREFLNHAAADASSATVRSRAARYSERSAQSINWIDETLTALRRTKAQRSQ